MERNDYYVYGYFEPGSDVPFYIGKGKGQRAYKHLLPCIVNKRKGHFYAKLRKMLSLGATPEIKILERNLTEESAFEAEKKLIARYGRRDSGDGVLLNHTDGGGGTSGYVLSEETRDKIRESARLRPPVSEETRAKLRLAREGWRHPPQTIEKMKGKVRSPESIEKLRNSLTGMSKTPEHCQKISEAKRGKRVLTPEQQKLDSERRQKPVESYDPKSGVTIKKYPSAKIASLDIEGGFPNVITKLCKGKGRVHCGLGWRYSTMTP